MQIKQNQTDPNWLTQNHSVDELGTGIFLLPDVDNEKPFSVIAKRVTSITYTSCVARGTLAVAFKWVPNRASSLDCSKESCKGDCATDEDCPNRDCCFCINGKCVPGV